MWSGFYLCYDRPVKLTSYFLETKPKKLPRYDFYYCEYEIAKIIIIHETWHTHRLRNDCHYHCKMLLHGKNTPLDPLFTNRSGRVSVGTID